jgi:DNA-directed RNA polymerase subunit RPC12/RpoP
MDQTTIQVDRETKNLLDAFKQSRPMTLDDVVRTLIRNGWTKALESGVVATPKNSGKIGDDAVQVGYECAECGNRIHGVTDEAGELPACDECGGKFWDRVVNELDIVYADEESNDNDNN